MSMSVSVSVLVRLCAVFACAVCVRAIALSFVCAANVRSPATDGLPSSGHAFDARQQR